MSATNTVASTAGSSISSDLSVTAKKRRRPRSHRHRTAVVASTFATILALIWAFPVYWMVKSSFQPNTELTKSPPDILPWSFTFDHYYDVLGNPYFWSALKMSLIASAITVVIGTVFSLFAAVGLSRFEFFGKRWFIIAILVVQMIPGVALFVSQYKMLDTLGLLNSVLGLAVLYVGGQVPFMVWVMRGYVDAIPVDLEQAAMIDGCTPLQAFFKVTLPLLVPGIVATGIFGFLFSWNEYILALVMLSKRSVFTLPLWLQTFQAGDIKGTDWGGVMAGATVIAIPVIILFTLVQTRLGQSATSGAVKG